MNHTSAAADSIVTISSENPQHLSIKDLNEQAKILGILFYTAQHFFDGFVKMFSGITDSRQPKKVIYQTPDLAFTAIFMFMCGLQARRQIALLIRGGRGADQFREFFGVPTCPHGDTLNDAFAGMDPAEFQAVLCLMVYNLIRKKVLYPYRILDRYYLIAIDGTWTLKRKARHCIAEKIKSWFPRLPVMLTIDGLFANGPVFRVCRELGWKFIVVLKDGSLPTVNQEFESLSALQPENRLTYAYLDRKTRVKQYFRWVNGIEYTDTEKTEHTVDVIECIQTREQADGSVTENKFKWVTNMRVSRRNVIELADHGGRLRWKVENEGFNVQKNGGYGLTHEYSKNDNSSKIFHILMQVAHLLKQLLTRGSLTDVPVENS